MVRVMLVSSTPDITPSAPLSCSIVLTKTDLVDERHLARIIYLLREEPGLQAAANGKAATDPILVSGKLESGLPKLRNILVNFVPADSPALKRPKPLPKGEAAQGPDNNASASDRGQETPTGKSATAEVSPEAAAGPTPTRVDGVDPKVAEALDDLYPFSRASDEHDAEGPGIEMSPELEDELLVKFMQVLGMSCGPGIS